MYSSVISTGPDMCTAIFTGCDTCRDDELAETSDPTTLVYDSATRMFWRNVNARSGNAPMNKLGRKPARYDIPEDVAVPPAVELLGEVTLQPTWMRTVLKWLFTLPKCP